MKESFFRSFGFTLIEILVAVTLSSFVLIGLVSFIGSGLDTVQKTEQGLRNILQGTEIDEILVSLQNDRSKSVGVGLLPAFYSTGFIFETSSSSKKYVFVGVRSATGICASSPDTPYDVLQIAVSDRSRTPVEISTGPYRLDPVSGKIWSGATHIIGRGYPGSRIGDPLTTELESPSSLAIIGSHLYIADPGNSRILSYDTISQKITNWLDPENGLSDPEFLLAEGNSLLIGGTQ